jgi:hypothetical protein
MELMQTLDDAWNNQDVKVFRERHRPEVVVRWPGTTTPTVGIEDHYMCSVARFRGTMSGPMNHHLGDFVRRLQQPVPKSSIDSAPRVP